MAADEGQRKIAAILAADGGCRPALLSGKAAWRWRAGCGRTVGLQLHARPYNLADFMGTLALAKEVEHWLLTTLREKLVKIGASRRGDGHGLSALPGGGARGAWPHGVYRGCRARPSAETTRPRQASDNLSHLRSFAHSCASIRVVPLNCLVLPHSS